jgi:probable rRNA maturation factor
MNYPIEIIYEIEPFFTENQFENYAQAVAKACNMPSQCEISILITNDEHIRQLNAQYRHKDTATDVLSFAWNEDEGFPLPLGEEHALQHLGDVIISLETLQENAKYFKVSPEEELKRVVIHSFLHLMGQEHLTNEAEEPMLKEQEKILEELKDLRLKLPKSQQI